MIPVDDPAGSDRDWATAPIRYRRLLFHALGRLAAQGFAVDLADGHDLIHQFIADQWPRLCRTFDPERGAFEPYLYGAFVRYARRRIIVLRRHKSRLVDSEQVERVLSSAESRVKESGHDLAIARDAIRRLPPERSRLLLEFLEGGPRCQRKLAVKHEMTRYRLREELAEAFAALLVALGEQANIADDDWRIAQSLWIDNRSPEETAQKLKVSTQAVLSSRRRLLDDVTASIIGATTKRRRRGKDA